MAPRFPEVSLRRFVLASELFLLRPYVIRHLTAKKVVKTAVKEEILRLHIFIVSFSKTGCH